MWWITVLTMAKVCELVGLDYNIDVKRSQKAWLALVELFRVRR